MSELISIVDYGVANLGSIKNMLKKVGATVVVISTPKEIETAAKIVLPGVGSFDHGISSLAERDLVEPLRNKVLEDRIPILGICLGMQLLGRSSQEGNLDGLGLISGRCYRFQFSEESKLKVPHMGWNRIQVLRDDELLAGIKEKNRFYFVHSYHLICDEPSDVLACATFGIDFAAVIKRENIYGCQFHPEKSHRFGMKLFYNFARMI